jgi:hypothetical protein
VALSVGVFLCLYACVVWQAFKAYLPIEAAESFFVELLEAACKGSWLGIEASQESITAAQGFLQPKDVLAWQLG